MDATVMGGRQVTSASLRLLNNELRLKNDHLNSSSNEWFFALHYGGDGREYLSDNVFRNEEEGNTVSLKTHGCEKKMMMMKK